MTESEGLRLMETSVSRIQWHYTVVPNDSNESSSFLHGCPHLSLPLKVVFTTLPHLCLRATVSATDLPENPHGGRLAGGDSAGVPTARSQGLSKRTFFLHRAMCGTHSHWSKCLLTSGSNGGLSQVINNPTQFPWEQTWTFISKGKKTFVCSALNTGGHQ